MFTYPKIKADSKLKTNKSTTLYKIGNLLTEKIIEETLNMVL